jgi:hypothetical protein
VFDNESHRVPIGPDVLGHLSTVTPECFSKQEVRHNAHYFDAEALPAAWFASMTFSIHAYVSVIAPLHCGVAKQSMRAIKASAIDSRDAACFPCPCG